MKLTYTAGVIQRLHKQILEISAREQQRIGQDLHDDLCQQLTGITLLTEILAKKLTDQNLDEVADVHEIQRLIAHAIVQTRSLAKGLLPVDITPDGLWIALEELGASTQRLHPIYCRIEGSGPVLIRDQTVAIQLYRIAQEAVANAVKHARATIIVLRLVQSAGRITLTISDDGVGIARNGSRKGGLGLSIMNSRAETIHADLTVHRGVKRGTVVSCSLRNVKPRPRSKGRHAQTR